MSEKEDDFESKVTTIVILQIRRLRVYVVPRAPRLQAPNATYHVTARGNRRQRIFLAPGDHLHFLKLVDLVARRRCWRFQGYCLMPNHYHLVVQTPGADLSAGMQYLNGAYAKAFNEQHGLDGHVFQGRFHAVLVESTLHLLELTRYLALNPVASGLCVHPDEWLWGSYGDLIGARAPRPFLAVDDVLHCFGRDASRAREALRAFVADGV